MDQSYKPFEPSSVTAKPGSISYLGKYLKLNFSLLVVFLIAGCNSTQTEVTKNKDKEAETSFFNTHIVSMTLESDKVRFVTDGKLTPVSPAAPANESFIIGVGERLITSPDEHASTEFTYRGVRDSSALFEYESRFDQRSFGKNLISIDRGEILVSFKTGK